MPNSLSDLHTLHAWEDNQITERCTQGEYAGKVLQFKLVDKDGAIDLTNCIVQYAVTRPDKTEDLLDCTVDNGIVKCNLTYSVTSISGLVHGEVRVIGSNNSGTIKFYGVNLRVYKGVSDEAVEQSDEFTALIAALQKVVSITPDPDSENTYVVRLDDSIVQNGLNPVASGVIYDYLQGNYRQISFAHENNESSYDDGGVYIDDATDIKKMYYVRNSNGARVGIIFCVQTPGYNYASQVKIDAYGNITTRAKTKESGESDYTWKSWTPVGTTRNIQDYAVTTPKLADGAVTSDKIDASVVTRGIIYDFVTALTALDSTITDNGTKPVASGTLKNYLEGSFQDYLVERFTKRIYAHETHSSGYDADTNPVNTYDDGGVYIDDATDIGTLYIIKTGTPPNNEMRCGILFCASTTAFNYATQIALYHNDSFKYRCRHSNGVWDESWTSIELQRNKDSYDSTDLTYFGISDNEGKYPNSKSLHKFIEANAQAIINSIVLGYDSLTIDKEYNIEKDKIQDYIKLSGTAPESEDDIPSGYTSDDYKDYASDTSYVDSVFDIGDTVYGSEAHGRPNKTIVYTVPEGSTTIEFIDTVTGRKWREPVTSPQYIQNLIPNHIYVFRFLDSNGVILQARTAKATGKIRMINAGGDTFNIRDIGGWDAHNWDNSNNYSKCGTLKYEVLYRGGELNDSISISSEQQEFFRNALGIRDEIDIREEDQNDSPSKEELVCSLGVGVSYLNQKIKNYSFTSGGSTSVFTDYANYKDVATVIKRIAKDIVENKPIYLHCKAGADRTGMICLFVEAICGVKRDDIDRDYELTAFSKEYKNSSWSRIRRKRNQSFGSYYNPLKDVVAGVNALTDGTNFNDKVVRFLLRTGVTIDEINAIRFGLIDGNPTALADPYSEATITKNLSHVFIDNEVTSVKLYQPFEANLTVEDWYKLNYGSTTSYEITMGGTDITSNCVNGKIRIERVTGNITIKAIAIDNEARIINSCSSKVISATIPSSGWSNNAQSLNLSSIYTVTNKTKVDIEADDTVLEQLSIDGCEGIYVENNNGTLTVKAIANSPTANITVQLVVYEVETLS